MESDVILYKFNVDPKSEEFRVTTHKILRQYGGTTSYNCKNVFLGKYVEEIDKGFFTYFKHVNSISVDAENEFFVSINNCLINKKKHTLIKVGNECNKIPEEVKIIGDHAFEGYSNDDVDELIIPENVIEIQGDAFKDSKLKKIVINHELKKISNNAMRGYDGVCDFLDCYFEKITNKVFRTQFCFQKVTNYSKKPLKPEYKTLFDSFISQFLKVFLDKYSNSSEFIHYLSTDWKMANEYKDICFEVSRSYKELSPIIINKIENNNEVLTFDALSDNEVNSVNFKEDDAYIEKYYNFDDNSLDKIKVTRINNGGAYIFPMKYHGKEVEFSCDYGYDMTIILRENYDVNVVKKFLKGLTFGMILQIECEYIPISFVLNFDYKKVIYGSNFKGFIIDKYKKRNSYSCGMIEVSSDNSIYTTDKHGKYLFNNIKKEVVLAKYGAKLPLDTEFVDEYCSITFPWKKYKNLRILNETCEEPLRSFDEIIEFPKNATEINLCCINFGLCKYVDGLKSIPEGGYTLKFSNNVTKITPSYTYPCDLGLIDMDKNNQYFDTYDGNCLVDKETNTLLLSTTNLKEIPDVKNLNLGAFMYGSNNLKAYVVPKSVTKINDFNESHRNFNYYDEYVKPSLIFNLSDKKFDKLTSKLIYSGFPFYNGGGTIKEYYVSETPHEVSYILLSNNRIIIRDAFFKYNQFNEIVEKLNEHNIELIGLENFNACYECRSLKIPKSVQYISEGSRSERGLRSCPTLISLEYKEDEVPKQLAYCLRKICVRGDFVHEYSIEYKK